MKLYETLAQRLISDIQSRRLPAGSKLPSLRTLAKQHSVSLNTANRTYDYLVENGWINAQPQSGYFVNSVGEAQLFPGEYSLPLERRDPNQFRPALGFSPSSNSFTPLGESLLSPELLPVQNLLRTIKRASSRAHHRLFQYPLGQGEGSIRLALAQHFRRYEFTFLPDELVITHSCLNAIHTAIETVTKPGDTLAVCSPCFSGLLELVAALSRHIIEIPISRKGIDLAALEKCMADNTINAALLSTTNINPLGMTLPAEQKKRIAELASTYQIPVIEDDVYFELSLPEYHVQPAKYWDTQGYVIWCSSISKTLAPGLRLGWCLPGSYFELFLNRHSKTNMGVNTLVQTSIAEFITTGEYHSHVRKNRQQLQNQLNQYRQILSEKLPDDALISTPMGGLVLWIKIPGLNTRQLASIARQHNIDIRSGDCFSTHDKYHDCFRINCGWPLNKDEKKSAVLDQLNKLCELINSQIKM